jgi:APA family basic amino acid/polyamine antiporter
VHPRYGTPYRPTIALGVFTAVVAGSTPIQKVAELVNIGVLSAFIVICSSVMILRKRKPDLHRAFRTPLVPLVPLIGIAFSIWLLSELPAITWKVFLGWVSLGLVIYVFYGMHKSKLEQLK